MSLFEAIVREDYDDPVGASIEATDIIRKLLVKDPTHRLGSLARGERDILEHPWFADLDLRSLRLRQTPAPWVPIIDDVLDCSNFDDWSHLEDRTKVKYERKYRSLSTLLFRHLMRGRRADFDDYTHSLFLFSYCFLFRLSRISL